MINLPNYQIDEKIFESANTEVYRGHRNEDNQPVILKVVKDRQEYKITHDLRNIEGVIKTYGLEKSQNILVLEDFGGESLDKLFKSPLDISDFLSIAIKITDILAEIHAANVIHKNINPSNIVLNPNTGQLKIIDFGISTFLPRENPNFKSPNKLEGTLAYISPEQTGRMNRVMDYRTDFYSLGVTFYQLLTQHLPFKSEDLMELVHHHLAKTPTEPHYLNSDIPKVISDIIMTLLEKNAEDRYQSARGIYKDLQRCQKMWTSTQQIESFTLAEQDFSDKLQIPQKLYGRDYDIKRLIDAFERTSQGEPEMMLVSGYSGIGKTALVQEIYKPITEKRGYFISGKFDQLQRDIPYTAIVNAFTKLVEQLLSENDTQLQEWKDKILAEVGDNGQVIIEIIPKLELIIDKQPDAAKLPPAESENRLNMVFKNFIKVFTKPKHPLVIFLDDLQWVDSASLKLIQLLMESTDIHALFLIGAYRDNEVSTVLHPLRLTLEEIQKAKTVVNKILLEPLALEHVNQLIADALHSDLGRTHDLARLVKKKTDANPFFIKEFMESLYAKKLLSFDIQQGVWQWDLPQIEAHHITDNVVEMMVEKIRQFSVDTQEALRFAACIGNKFDIDILATVLEQTYQETVTHLQEAIMNGQILVTNKKSPADINMTTWSFISECQFAHDRIQEAAYSLISDEQKPEVHRQIGQLLLQNTPLEEREQKIFDIVDHWNKGIKLINQQSERDELAKLNLSAGQKAKASAAYKSAFAYLKIGIKLLADDCWQTQYDLTLALHEEGAEAAYLSGDFKQIEEWNEVILQKAKILLDKVKAYEIYVRSYIAQNRPIEAINIVLPVLQQLGVKFPKNPNKFDYFIFLIKTKIVLARKGIKNLINLPEMTDPFQLAAMRILSSIFSAAYYTDYKLRDLIVLKQINLLIKHGNAPISALIYKNYGFILCKEGDIDAGYKFGQLPFKIKEYKSKILCIRSTLINHWKEPVKKVLPDLLEGYKIGLETGDFEFASISAYVNLDYLYITGKELTVLLNEIQKKIEVTKQLRQEKYCLLNRCLEQAILNLCFLGENPCHLVGNNYNEDKMLPRYHNAKDNNAIFVLYEHKLVLCYLFGKFNQAIKNAKLAEKYLDAVAGTLIVTVFHFYDSLVRLALYKKATKQEQRQYSKKIKSNQKKMKKWASHAPMNHQHKFYLVEAEWHHHVLGENWKAMELYDKAIAGANKNEYINDEALAYELAAKFYKDIGKDKFAQVYFKDAHNAYTKWGAMAKVKHLEEHYPQFFKKIDSTPSNSSTLSGTTIIQNDTIDLISVIKTSQEIASKIDLKLLLKKLIKIVLENAGAQRGVLILENNGQWLIEADGTIDEVTVLQSIPISNSWIPKSIIDYVIRMKEENVVLSDATQKGRFTNDLYIVEHQIKSILCMPLLNQGELTNLLYLENKTAEIFTPDKLELLKLLSSQIVISIKNARHYNEMLEMNMKYDKEIAELKKKLG